MNSSSDRALPERIATNPPAHATQSVLPLVLLVDADPAAAEYENAAFDRFRTAVATSCAAARQMMSRAEPIAIVTELVMPDGRGADLCRAAKALPQPPTVLVATADKELVPDAIDAGCDGVLLKPFSPNLLFARLGRLLRARADALRLDAAARRSRRTEGTPALPYGTTSEYWDRACTHCRHQGVITFDYASQHRAWYACLACRRVWLDRAADC